jgi:hypothetical protein
MRPLAPASGLATGAVPPDSLHHEFFRP